MLGNFSAPNNPSYNRFTKSVITMRSLPLVVTLLSIYKICIAYENNSEYLSCFRKICIPSDYDSLLTPITVEPTPIRVDFFYLQLLKVDDYDCTITVKFLLQLYWREPRLRLLRNAINYVTLPREFIGPNHVLESVLRTVK